MKRKIFTLALVLGATTLAFTSLVAQAAQAPAAAHGGGTDDWGRTFFPPDLVMQHQS